jgi:photosystem II stability/assembly factor-like uncharacterized protein
MKNKTFLCLGLILSLFLGCKKTEEAIEPIPEGSDIPFENSLFKVEILKNDSTVSMRKIHFFDESNGVGISYNGIFQTQNKGLNWVKKYSLPQLDSAIYFYFRDIHFINNKIGFVTGGHSGCPGCKPPTGLILKTTDGGNTWQPIYQTSNSRLGSMTHDTNSELYTYEVSSTNNISPNYAITKIIRSEDFGQTWKTVSTLVADGNALAVNENSIFLTSIIQGVGKVFKGYNDGGVWSEIPLGENLYTTQISFKNGVGYCLVGNKKLLKTTDNGQSWETVFTDKNSSAQLNLLSNDRCLLIRPFYIFKDSYDHFQSFGAIKQSGDGGRTWNEVVFKSALGYAHFYDDSNGYILTRSGLAKVSLK